MGYLIYSFETDSQSIINMGKRRDFIKKGALGLTVGLTAGSIGSCQSPNPAAETSKKIQKNWQTDPEWIKIKYGDWGGPGVFAETGPMDKILLKDHAPKSSVVTTKTFLPKAKYPVIDAHVHSLAKTPSEVAESVSTMDEVGIQTSVILTGVIGEEFDTLIKRYVEAYPGRFILFCGMDMTNIDQPDYPDRVVAELERCYQSGAAGVGEISDKGYGITGESELQPDERLHPDDPRLDAFWRKCADLKIPINLHVADHPSCWTPLDIYQERLPEYQHFSKYGQNVPTHTQLIEKRNKTLEKHPNTTFIACHLGNQGHDLESLSKDMDKYPNLYVDTSARDYELGRTPRTSAKFIQKYKDRVVFGTDQDRNKSMYQVHWRLLETADEYIEGRVGWRYYGLELPDSSLEAIYRSTVKRLLNIQI